MIIFRDFRLEYVLEKLLSERKKNSVQNVQKNIKIKRLSRDYQKC